MINIGKRCLSYIKIASRGITGSSRANDLVIAKARASIRNPIGSAILDCFSSDRGTALINLRDTLEHELVRLGFGQDVAHKSAKKAISRYMATCDECKGSGVINYHQMHCGTCRGTGRPGGYSFSGSGSVNRCSNVAINLMNNSVGLMGFHIKKEINS